MGRGGTRGFDGSGNRVVLVLLPPPFLMSPWMWVCWDFIFLGDEFVFKIGIFVDWLLPS